jgi:ankyrin repeat protein
VLAAGNGHLEATHALLEGGADPKITTSDGWYAYHFAKNSRHEAVAARLLEAHGGAEPVYDYAAAFLKKAEPQQLAVYDRLFARDAIEKKRSPATGVTRTGPTRSTRQTTTTTTGS